MAEPKGVPMRCPRYKSNNPDRTKFYIECRTPSGPSAPNVGRTRSPRPSSVRATTETLRFAAGYSVEEPA